MLHGTDGTAVNPTSSSGATLQRNGAVILERPTDGDGATREYQPIENEDNKSRKGDRERGKKSMSKKKEKSSLRRCGECANAYDFHERGADGTLFLCRCEHRKERGKFPIFVDDYGCEHFTTKKREENEK